jgi:hypothetical protein
VETENKRERNEGARRAVVHQERHGNAGAGLSASFLQVWKLSARNLCNASCHSQELAARRLRHHPRASKAAGCTRRAAMETQRTEGFHTEVRLKVPAQRQSRRETRARGKEMKVWWTEKSKVACGCACLLALGVFTAGDSSSMREARLTNAVRSRLPMNLRTVVHLTEQHLPTRRLDLRGGGDSADMQSERKAAEDLCEMPDLCSDELEEDEREALHMFREVERQVCASQVASQENLAGVNVMRKVMRAS